MVVLEVERVAALLLEQDLALGQQLQLRFQVVLPIHTVSRCHQPTIAVADLQSPLQ